MEKVSLPVKTKIAAWWIKILGITTLIFSVLFGVGVFLLSVFAFGWMRSISGIGYFIFFLISLVCMLIVGFLGRYIFSVGRRLSKLEKKAWHRSVLMFSTILTIYIICSTSYYFGEIHYYVKKGTLLQNSEEFFSLVVMLIILFVLLVPLIFLFLDRKNFWKIAT